MKKLVFVVGLTLLCSSQPAVAADVGFDMNINIGNGGGRVAAPVQAAPQIVIEEPPEFIYPQSLGFYVAVGVPYDLFYLGDSYYVFRDNRWYRGPHYRGPWSSVQYRNLPPGLRRHKFERIKYYRDEEYRHYRDDRERYHGKRFRPDKELKEERKHERKAEKRQEKEEKRWEKEERKHNKHD
jgi:hypothetical protein